MKMTINFKRVTYPIVGAWEPTEEGLTLQVECQNDWSDASTGEGPFQCGKKVWINPQWIESYEQFWPVHRPGILCPDCAEATGLSDAKLRFPVDGDDFE